MKILVISNMYPSSEVPNYGTFVRNFCDELEKLNIDFDKIVITKKKSKSIGLMVFLIYYIKIIFTLIFKSYDKVYVHYASHNAVPLILVNKFKRIEVFTNVHGGDVVPQTTTQKKMQKYTKKLLQISSKVIVPSLYFKELIISSYNISENKIEIYPSAGVKENLFYPYSLEKKKNIKIANLNLNMNFKYIGFVSRIEQGKGWDTFLKALFELKKNNELRSIKAVIIGTGNEYNDFLQMVNDLHLSNDVVLIESLEQSHLPKIYNSLSVFCFPTERTGESLGLVGLEALACGVPVIASDFAAPKYYIKEGYNGFKFEKGEPKLLARKINEFFNLPVRDVNLLRENAHNTGSSYYSNRIRNDLKKILN